MASAIDAPPVPSPVVPRNKNLDGRASATYFSHRLIRRFTLSLPSPDLRMQTLTPSTPAATPYTREALVALAQGMRTRFMLEMVAVPVVLAAAAWGVMKAMGATGQNTQIAAMLALLAGPMVAGIVAEVRVRMRSPACPACSARLVSSSGRLLLSGDACARCGTEIVGAGPGTPAALPSRAEFMTRYNAVAGPWNRWVWTGGITLVAAGAGIFALERGWLPRSLEPLMIALALLCVLSVVMACVKVTRPYIRSAGLNCTTCHDPLIGGPGGHLSRHTLQTGTCPWCHAPVWR